MGDVQTIVNQLISSHNVYDRLHHQYNTLLQHNNNNNNNDNSVYYPIYQQQLLQHSNQIRLLNELSQHIKRIITRRKAIPITEKIKQEQNNHNYNDNNDTENTDKTIYRSSENTSSILTLYRISHPSISYEPNDIWTHNPTECDLPCSLRVCGMTDRNSIPPIWILCYIDNIKQRPKLMYEVRDIDSGKHHLLPPDSILPLPTLHDIALSQRKLFNIDDDVLAWFPSTTVMYPAKVVKQPTKNKSYYVLQFDDDDVDTRDIPADLVAPIK